MKSFDIYKCKLVKESTFEYNKKSMKDCADVMDLIVDLGFDLLPEEHLGMFCLNVKGEVIAFHEVSHGEIAATNCHPREIFKRAILNNAAGIIVFHNHPSGDATPSNEDILGTRRMLDAGQILGIKVVDHLVVSEGKYCSLRVEGIIPSI